MAYIELSRPSIYYYSSEVEFHTYVYELEPDEYVEYFFDVSAPEKISVLFEHASSGKFRFRIYDNSNFFVNTTVLIYTFDSSLNKVVKEILTATQMLYPDTLEAEYIFDELPRPAAYDSTYYYKNELVYKPLEVSFWRPDEKKFELPYYYPIIANINGGIPPYKITWKILENGELPSFYQDRINADYDNLKECQKRLLENLVEEDPEKLLYLNNKTTSEDYAMFSKYNVCSLVFLKLQKYYLEVIVEDAGGNKFQDVLIVESTPNEIINDYVFDLSPEAEQYDDTYITYERWTKHTYKKHTDTQYNYYVGKYSLSLDFPIDVNMNYFLPRVKEMINQEVSPKQMWERYYASEGYCFYGLSSRYDIYEYNKVHLLHLYIDEQNNLCYNLRLISSYNINSAVNRILQAIRWVCTLHSIPIIKHTIVTDIDIKSTPYMDYVLDGMKKHIESLVIPKYFKLELDDRYKAVQMDVDSYLSRLHKYNYV